MIVLLTDFGRSEYVGVMKGVIYGIAEAAKVVDLCHTIEACNIIEGSWILKNNYHYFPERAVFCCVVDPGVGTERKALGIRTEKYCFVGPDNGLLWGAVKEDKKLEIREITTPPEASRTFHGRDVFAKAAAEIERGGFEKIGERIERMEKLEFHRNGREGIVVRVDGFGNIITNLPDAGKDEYLVEIRGQKCTMGYSPTYAGAKEGQLFLIEGSCSTLEISLKGGSANDKLGVKAGQRIKIF
jgi:S-adenosylmethionine hydrolase